MSKLIDSKGNVILEGSPDYIETVYRLMICHPADVTEQDEVMYEKELHLSWFGRLRIEHDKNYK